MSDGNGYNNEANLATLNDLRTKYEQTSFGSRQIKVIFAAGLNVMMEFFDSLLMGISLAAIVGPWNLTFGTATIITLAGGAGGVIGAFLYGRLAEVLGRKTAIIVCIINFNIAAALTALTPEFAVGYLAVMRILMGIGTGGLIVIIIPLVQELTMAKFRGRTTAITSMFIQFGSMFASGSAAALMASIGWRGVYLVSLVPMLFLFFVAFWLPESPRWLENRGRYIKAANVYRYMLKERSRFWDAQDKPEAEHAKGTFVPDAARKVAFSSIFKYPRSVLSTFFINFGLQNTTSALNSWGVTLLVMTQQVPPEVAAGWFVIVAAGGLVGRFMGGFLLDSIGRRATGILYACCTAAVGIIGANTFMIKIGGTFPFMVILLFLISCFAEGGTGMMVSFIGEVWPKHLRAIGQSWGAGMGNVARVVAPMILGLIFGASNLIRPEATVGVTPNWFYFMAIAMIITFLGYFIAFETKGKSIEEIDKHFMEQAKK